MAKNLSSLVISVTKPDGKPASLLSEMGIQIIPIEEDEGNVDRYVLSKRLALERRTGSSFLRGVMDKTLFTSAIFLREHFEVPVLMVEGTVNYEYSAFNPQAVRGALSSMMLLYGISVLSTSDIDETVQLIAMMARQEQVGIPEISLIPKRKAVYLPDMQRRIVEMLPGCGMVMARDLLQHFGSVRRIMNATKAGFRSLQGIGARKASEIIRVLNSEYEAVDTERNLEDAIEAEPSLLFRKPMQLLARQHCIFTEGKEKHVVDMIFLDTEADEVILVELKRGRLTHEHYLQLRRYLDHAGRSKLLAGFLEKGAKVRGVLATVEDCEYGAQDDEVRVCLVDRKRVIRVLKNLRDQRLGRSD